MASGSALGCRASGMRIWGGAAGAAAWLERRRAVTTFATMALRRFALFGDCLCIARALLRGAEAWLRGAFADGTNKRDAADGDDVGAGPRSSAFASGGASAASGA